MQSYPFLVNLSESIVSSADTIAPIRCEANSENSVSVVSQENIGVKPAWSRRPRQQGIVENKHFTKAGRRSCRVDTNGICPEPNMATVAPPHLTGLAGSTSSWQQNSLSFEQSLHSQNLPIELSVTKRVVAFDS